MKILSPALEHDITTGKPLRLDLGCGRSPRQGCYSVDHLEMPGIDVVADLNCPLDLLPDNSCDYIYSRHVLEHIQEFMPLMREIHRITRPGGTVEIIVPHFSNVYGYSDPTHVRFFGVYSMSYFSSPLNQPHSRKVPSFYTDFRFRLKSVRVEFYRLSMIDKLVAPLLTRIVNRSPYFQDIYERRLSHLFHAWQVNFLLEPEK